MDGRQSNSSNRERVAQSFTLTYSYDDKGRVKTRTLPSGEVIEYTYNGEDKKKVGVLSGIYLKGLWDKPIVTGMNQDRDTSLVQQFNFGNGIANTLQKDKNGRIVLAGNPKVGQTTLNYDLKQKQLEPESVKQTYSAQMGDTIHPQSGMSKQVRQVLDQVVYNRNPEPLFVQQVDVVEQISQAPEMDRWGRTVRQGDQHYQYNSQNRLIKITSIDETGQLIPIADLATPLITSYRYDKDGSMVGTTLPDGIKLLSDGNQIRYKAPDDIMASTIYSESTHQAFGVNQISYQLVQHIVMGHFYDDNGQFSGLSYRNLLKSSDNPFIRSARADEITPLFSQQWQRTSDGIVEQVTELDYRAKPTEHNYLYDSQYHLVNSSYQPVKLDGDFAQVTTASQQINSEVNNDITEARYIYDEIGNRMLGIDDSKTLKKYEYDDKGRLTAIKPITQGANEKNLSPHNIAYDDAGLPTEYGDYQLSYTAGQLSQIKDSKGQIVAEYTYNDEGQRIKKTIYQKERKSLPIPESSYYVYEDSQLQHELDDQGNIIRHYVYIGNTLTVTLDYPAANHGELLNTEQSSISLWARGKNWIGSLWTHNDAYPTINYVITDYLGRPRQVRDGETNALRWQFKPTTFGGQMDDNINASTNDSSYELNVRFPGQYEDTETGLYYNHWRYYDQQTGRYLSDDPLGLGGGENLYTYVNATPTHFIDPPGLLLFAFDGTGNQDYGSGKVSNVVKFRDLYRKDPNEPSVYAPNNKWKYAEVNGKKLNFKEQKKSFSTEHLENNVFYMAGAGTTDQYSDVSADFKSGGNKLDLGHGLSIVLRVDAMVGYLYDYLDRVYKDPSLIQRDEKGVVTSNHKIHLDVVGFSRGAASARMFASKVETILSTGYWDTYDQTIAGNPTDPARKEWKYTSKFLEDCGINFNFNFMGLLDTVPAYGSDQDNDMADSVSFGMDLGVNNTFKSVVHAVEMNENRYQFARRSIFNDHAEATLNNGETRANGNFRLEKGFLGAHSDIGGGYKEGDLSNAALMWIIKHAKNANIKFDDKQIISKKYNQVNDPIVHDSTATLPVFTPGGEFRWANDNSKDYAETSIFNTHDHLELFWEGTKMFENPAFKRFEKVKEATEKFKESTVRKPWFLYKYNDLKQKGKDENNAILIGTATDRIIRINDYLNWLDCHYDLSLSTTINYDIRAPVKKDKCSSL